MSRAGVVAAYNMVAAMNEHLSSTSATNSVRSTTTAGPKDSSNKPKDLKLEKDKAGIIPAEDSSGKVVGILGFPCDFDHMYASMTDGGAPASATSALAGVSPLRENEARQNDLTEVKHLKELLLLHLDLIQQQSEQIVTKDKLLAALRQENETVYTAFILSNLMFALPPYLHLLRPSSHISQFAFKKQPNISRLQS